MGLTVVPIQPDETLSGREARLLAASCEQSFSTERRAINTAGGENARLGRSWLWRVVRSVRDDHWGGARPAREVAHEPHVNCHRCL